MWTGTHFVPQNSQLRQCREQFGDGEIVMLERHEERDMNSHSHYFASINEAWKNLPEALDAEYPSPDALRKKMLIKSGYANEKVTVCDTAHDAAIMAAYIAPLHQYGIVEVRGNVIRVYEAKSQSLAAMGKKEFQASKWAVLDAISAMIHTSTRQLQDNAGRSA